MLKFIEKFYYDNLDPPPRHRNHQSRTHIYLKPKRQREISAAFNIAVEKFMDVWYNNLKPTAVVRRRNAFAFEDQRSSFENIVSLKPPHCGAPTALRFQRLSPLGL